MRGRERFYPWVLVLGSALLFFARANMPLTDGDSALYGAVAKNVLSSGDWVVMGTRGWLLDKPPLTIWLTAIGIKLFGAIPLALRWWHSLMAVCLVLGTYGISRQFFEPATGFLAGAITGTSVLVWYSGIVPQQDVPAVLFAVVTLYGLIRYVEGRSVAGYYILWLGAALAALNRAFAGLILPASIAVAHIGLLVLRGTRPRILPGAERGAAWAHFLAGPLLFVAIVAPWFVLGYLRMGYRFIDYHLFSGNARFFTNPRGGSGFLHFWSYIPLLIASFLPWSGLIFHALQGGFTSLRHVVTHSFDQCARAPAGLLGVASARVRKCLRFRCLPATPDRVHMPESGTGRPESVLDGAGPGKTPGSQRHISEHTGDTFFLVWFLAAFALPFALRWRVIRYLLPSIPPLAVLSARFLAPFFTGTFSRSHLRRLKVVATLSCVVVVPLVAALTLIVAGRFPEDQARYLPVVAVPIAGLGISLAVFVALCYLGRARAAVSLLVGLTALSYLGTFFVLGSKWEEVAPWQTMSLIIDSAAAPSSPVVAAEVPQDELVFLDFYVNRPIEPMKDPSWLHAPATGCSAVIVIAGNSAVQSVLGAAKILARPPELLFEAPSGTQVLRFSFAGQD